MRNSPLTPFNCFLMVVLSWSQATGNTHNCPFHFCGFVKAMVFLIIIWTSLSFAHALLHFLFAGRCSETIIAPTNEPVVWFIPSITATVSTNLTFLNLEAASNCEDDNIDFFWCFWPVCIRTQRGLSINFSLNLGLERFSTFFPLYRINAAAGCLILRVARPFLDCVRLTFIFTPLRFRLTDFNDFTVFFLILYTFPPTSWIPFTNSTFFFNFDRPLIFNRDASLRNSTIVFKTLLIYLIKIKIIKGLKIIRVLIILYSNSAHFPFYHSGYLIHSFILLVLMENSAEIWTNGTGFRGWWISLAYFLFFNVRTTGAWSLATFLVCELIPRVGNTFTVDTLGNNFLLTKK